MNTLIKLILLFFFVQSHSQSTIITEEVDLKNDSIVLPGTLTYNKTLKQQPLVIFVHGSGNVDRNGNQAGMASPNYIMQLSEALNTKDIAFYRYDKRAANMANVMRMMQTKQIGIDDYAKDLRIAINHFKNDTRFSDITLIGHSQGSLVAMLESHKDISKYISLAGASGLIEPTIVKQVRTQNGDSIANITIQHFKELKEKGAIANIDKNLMALFNPLGQALMSSWMKYNPTEEIKKITIPILILNGSKDLQVSEQDAVNLHQANSNSKLVIIGMMNHVLKTIVKDENNFSSYATPEFPLSKKLVSEIDAFIKQ